jgi:hypothetical protein
VYHISVKFIRNGILISIIFGLYNMMLHAGVHLDHDTTHAPCQVCILSGFVVQSKSPTPQTIVFPIIEVLVIAGVFFVPFMVMRDRSARSPPLPLLGRI